jgi:diguanylate cyclase (GGDEF)-like protein/PAS domain S-box-containing protein
VAQHILLVQDDDAGAGAVKSALRHAATGSYQLEWIRTCDAAVRRLTAHRDGVGHHSIAAILADLALPDRQGLEALDRLSAAAQWTPILVLCAATEEQVARLALRRGADDYLVKERIDDYSLPKMLSGMIERTARAMALTKRSERMQATLDSIGDAVIGTDVECRVTYLNVVAEHLTGWSCSAAEGRPIEEVFCVIDAATRAIAENPMSAAIRANAIGGLAPNCILLARDGLESAIEDSAAPIRDRQGHVTGAVLVFRDVSATRAQAQRMSHLAHHDSLTNLPNRVLLNDRLAQALALAARYGRKVSVLFVDIDRFKPINDSLGHDVGDRLLQLVAERLVSSVRASDTVSRLGGDEFVVVLPHLDHAHDGAASAEKILRAVRGPYGIGTHEIPVTASIGIAMYPGDGRDATTLLRSADTAMYAVKETGGDNFAFAATASAEEDAMDPAGDADRLTERALDAALTFASRRSRSAG